MKNPVGASIAGIDADADPAAILGRGRRRSNQVMGCVGQN